MTDHHICIVVAEVLPPFLIDLECRKPEVIETVNVEHQTQGNSVLEELHDLGLQLSINELGTGYSSLSLPGHLPLHNLKTDLSIIEDIFLNSDDAAVIEEKVLLNNKPRLSVIAGGVETEGQEQVLSDQRCNHRQAYMHRNTIGTDGPIVDTGRIQ